MGKIPNDLREAIARNIKTQREKKFPGRGGGKKCAEAFGVSPQQWSPWERGMRTPDEMRLKQIADFFELTVEDLRRDNREKRIDTGIRDGGHYGFAAYGESMIQAGPPALREPEAPPYGLPSLRREDSLLPLSNISELSHYSGRLMSMVCSIAKGVMDGRYDAGKTIIVLRRLSNILEDKLREAESPSGDLPPPPPSF